MSGKFLTQEIARVVCGIWPVTIAQLQARSLSRRHSVPRQVAYWLCVRHGGRSTKLTGWWFGRDHSSVVYGVQAVDARMARDPHFAAQVMKAVGLVKLLRPAFGLDCAWPAPMPAFASFQSVEVLQ